MTKKQKGIILAASAVAIIIAAILAGYTAEEVGTLVRAIAACVLGVI